jgi:hypothetical protein
MKCAKRLAAARITALAICVAPLLAQASVVTDPANDFIPTFTGPHSGDLDLLSVSSTFDGVAFHIGATVNGNIGTLGTSLYVLGFNQGAGTSNFAAIGLPGVAFDSVITVTGTGVTGGRDLPAATAIVLPANALHINGSHFDIDILASLLPSKGLAFGNYGINLWSRDSSQVGNAAIADFASASTSLAVPEPQSAALVLLGLGIAALVRSRTVPLRAKAIGSI